MNHKRFFVTGGAGFIGTALLASYETEFEQWCILDNLLEQVHGKSPKVPVGGNIHFINSDIRNLEQVSKALNDTAADVIFHFAAETGTSQSADNPELHTDVNVNGTAVLIHALNLTPIKPKVIVLTSSRAVYGEGPWQKSNGEIFYPLGRSKEQLENQDWDYEGAKAIPAKASSSLPTPCNVYGATKLAQEHLLSAWCAANNVVLVVLRLQNVYGPGQSPINPYTGVTNFFFETAKSGNAIPVYEDGSIHRDFVFIDDVIQALKQATELKHSEIADVGSGQKNSIYELANYVREIAGGPAPKVTGQYRLGDVRHAACDMTGSEWVRGSKAPEKLKTGLTKLADWLNVQTSFVK